MLVSISSISYSLKDGIELSRGRTNRLIKTLQQLDLDCAETQSLNRAQTFKSVSPKKSGDFGTKSHSSATLNCDIPYPEDKGDDELSCTVQQRAKNEFKESTTKARQSMMNEYDSE